MEKEPIRFRAGAVVGEPDLDLVDRSDCGCYRAFDPGQADTTA